MNGQFALGIHEETRIRAEVLYFAVQIGHKSWLPMINLRLLIDRFTMPLIAESKTPKIVEVKVTDT